MTKNNQGEVLRKTRLMLGKSQADMCRVLAVDRKTYSKWEKEGVGNMDRFLKVLLKFNLDVSQKEYLEIQISGFGLIRYEI